MVLLCAISAQAQREINYCGQVEARQRLFQTHPQCIHDVMVADQQLEDETAAAMDSQDERDQVFIIPVVFHIIHNYGAENISDEQVLNGLEILNRDFRKLNADISQVVPEFQGITADIEIEFRIANLDPNGSCTSGITRTVSALTYEGDDDMKALIYWPRNKYMNVWVCADAAGAAGYTNLPADVNNAWSAWKDGIVIRHDYLGAIGTSSVGHSRVLTHEVGHWLNLRHCWGNSNSPGLASNCNQDDNVSDTPNTMGWTTCNLAGATCNSALDNVQNYMEYSYCTRMFTLGQRTRMRTAVQSNVAQRNQLWTNTNLTNTGVLSPILCAADFAVSKTNGCAGTPIQFTDNSYNGVTEWSWDFGDGTTLTGNDPLIHQNPQHSYTAPGNYSVTLVAGNGNSTVQVTKNNLIAVLPNGQQLMPFEEGFETTWPGDNWFLNNVNNDATWQTSALAAYSGSKSLRLLNNNNSLIDNTDEIITTTFDASGMDTVLLSYKWAFANRLTATDDRLRISISGDCGNNWALKKLHKGLTDLPTAPATNASFVPSGPEQWSGNTLILANPNWMTENFRVKFEFVAKGGNNIYLDDINITGIDTAGNVVSLLQSIRQHSLSAWVFPNPASEQAVCQVELNRGGDLAIDLYNELGQHCERVANSINAAAGIHTFGINAQPRGVYSLVIRSGGQQIVRRLVFD